ncbi:S-inosyl-L-homocysteine hydrolase [Alphaproteobacteria bacterium SO-S41]|nr:S-inosyl-L-homocysteine hydrolase [Alphaproteobacteria bacterium SO-S41]
MSLISPARRAFFADVAGWVGRQADASIVITHLLPQRGEFLDALNQVAPIAAVIPIPYSVHAETLELIRKSYPVAQPTLETMLDPQAMTDLIEPYLGKGRTALIEIGGYFAPALPLLKAKYGDRILGCLEDTEAGHRRYDAAAPLLYPCVSVARSKLKQAEDTLVGPSCVFSAERLLKGQGLYLHARRALVLGYGKVGRGAARALDGRDAPASVYDTNPVQRALAMSEGFPIPEREHALANADIVFGCTGTTSVGAAELAHLKSGAILVSCSSKRVEFDVVTLDRDYAKTNIAPHVDAYTKGDQTLYLLGNGAPLNFLDGGIGGPALSLVQAEIMAAVKTLATATPGGGVIEVDAPSKQHLAALWCRAFSDPVTGAYRM